MARSPHLLVARLLPIALAACAAAPSSVRDPHLAAQATTAEQWFEAARHSFDAANSKAAMTPALVEALRGAQVVGIGEASHGTHEDVQFKAELALALVDAGIVDTLYLEANHAGAAQLDAFIHGSDGDARAAVLQAPIFRVLKTEAFVACVAGLQVRAASGRRVRIVGIDCQDTARDTELALTRLARTDAAAADSFRARLSPVAGAEGSIKRHPELVRSLRLATINECVATLEQLEKACGADADAAYAARRAWQGLAAMRMEASDADSNAFSYEEFSLRDRYMAENILRDGGAGVFWGHNFHVAGGEPRGVLQGYKPTGAMLRRELDRRYRAVLFDYGTASIRAVIYPEDGSPPDATKPAEVVERELLPGSLAEAVRGKSGGSCWLDMARLPAEFASWRAAPRQFDWPGFATSRTRTAEETASLPFDNLGDVLVVVDTLHPSRPLE